MRCLISFLFAGLLFAACKKENNNPQLEGPSYMGAATMLLNGEEANFSTLLAYSYNSVKEANLLITEFSQPGYQRKSLAISNIPVNKDKHRLIGRNLQEVKNAETSYATFIADGDVAGNYYYLNEQDEIEDFIQFTHIDEATREVKGIFQASFYVDISAIFDPSSPDTIIITDGYFETVLQER